MIEAPRQFEPRNSEQAAVFTIDIQGNKLELPIIPAQNPLHPNLPKYGVPGVAGPNVWGSITPDGRYATQVFTPNRGKDDIDPLHPDALVYAQSTSLIFPIDQAPDRVLAASAAQLTLERLRLAALEQERGLANGEERTKDPHTNGYLDDEINKTNLALTAVLQEADNRTAQDAARPNPYAADQAEQIKFQETVKLSGGSGPDAAEAQKQLARELSVPLMGSLLKLGEKHPKLARTVAAASVFLASCGAPQKSPEPTSTPRIVQTVDVVKPTATATTPFETPTPPVVTKEQLANVLIQQDTYTADVIESWKGDMTPTQLLARKVLKGELGPEDDAAEVRSMSYSMKNAGGFSFDIAASASDQSKMRIGFVSPDSSLQMRDVRAVQEQNGAVSLLMTQEGKILVIARKSPDGTAFVINPADASGVIKKIGDNSPELSLGKDIIVIPPSPTPGPKQPNLDLLAYLFPPQIVKAESPPTPSPTTGTVFSDTGEARASATPFTTTATVTAPITGSETLTRTELAPTILTEIQRSEGVSDTTYRLNAKESGGVGQISIANITFKDGMTARPDFTPKAVAGLSDMTLAALVINQSLSVRNGGLPNPEDMPALLAALKSNIAANKPIELNMVRVSDPGTFKLMPYPTRLQPIGGALNIKVVDADNPQGLPPDCDIITTGTNTVDGTLLNVIACVGENTIYLGVDPSVVRATYNSNDNKPVAVTSSWLIKAPESLMSLAMVGATNPYRIAKNQSDGGALFGTQGSDPTSAAADWGAPLRGKEPTKSISKLFPGLEKFVHKGDDGKYVIDAIFKVQ